MTLAISRRSLLGATAALPVMAIPATAAPAEYLLDAKMRASRQEANVKFWKLHAQLEALEAEWSACPDDDRVSQDRISALVSAKYDEAIMQPVSCPLAVLAKLKLMEFEPGNAVLPYPAETGTQMIEWDLERCAKEKLLG
ncbi:hypothetical protein [Novosphingobium humi]|uniref:Secreted protein n=1 Tax=Novosphingobium humi TaxID=2282397 RepID=A0ABY7TSZ6_9SPHN|nr:hypothetical protein [Novosphingobium humi]WCT76336.1 hypothetical protein PQ457_10270 [Novosphingobium humi]